MNEESKDPIAIVERMMDMPFCHMHGPEHHVMVGASLLTAYKNAGGDIDLGSALIEMMHRGKSVPGGACVFWGLENNCTRMISSKSTYGIVVLKGVFSGLGSFIIALIRRERFPAFGYINAALCLGFVAYGLSIFLYARA